MSQNEESSPVEVGLVKASQSEEMCSSHYIGMKVSMQLGVTLAMALVMTDPIEVPEKDGLSDFSWLLLG